MNYNKKSFDEVCQPLIEWLNKNANPHSTVIVTVNEAELLSGEIVSHKKSH